MVISAQRWKTGKAAIAALQPSRSIPRGITSASEGLRIAQEWGLSHSRRVLLLPEGHSGMACIWLRRPGHNDFAGLDRSQSFGTGGHDRQQVPHAIRFRTEDQNRDAPQIHVLLVFYVLIAGKEYIPSALSERKKLTVLLGSPARLLNGSALMTPRAQIFT